MAETRFRLRIGLGGLIAASLAMAASGGAQSPGTDAALAKGKRALDRGDGVGAEIAFKDALKAGAPRDAVAGGIGEALLDQNKRSDARIWLGPAKFAPTDALRGLRILSRLEIADGHLAAAGQALDRALAINDKSPEVWVDIAQLRYRGGEQVQAVDAVDRALAADSSNIRALEFRGLMVRDQFGAAAALPWFEAALLRAPNDGTILGDYAATLGDLGRARQMLVVTRRMRELGAQTPKALYLEAVLAARAGNGSLARSLLNKAGQGILVSPAGLQLDGVLQLQAGNPMLAAQSLGRLADLQPYNERAQLLLARALYANGQQAQLVERFGQAARHEGASAYLMTLVGRALEDLGRRAEAAPMLGRAATARSAGLVLVAPEQGANAGENGNLGEAAAIAVRTQFANGRFDDAIGIADRLRSDYPGMGAAEVLAGDAYFSRGRYDLALERYGIASQVRTDDALLSRLVISAALAGRRDAAAGKLGSYFAANPQSHTAARLAADYAGSIGRWDRARLLLEHLRRNGGDRDVRLLSDLAFAQMRLGDRDAARATAAAAWTLQRASPVASQAWAAALMANGKQSPLAASLLARARHP
ncbi:MAG: tetratricopeptide repeat protein [Novosphingobium sp.]